jgi:hypothetical protein
MEKRTHDNKIKRKISIAYFGCIMLCVKEVYFESGENFSSLDFEKKMKSLTLYFKRKTIVLRQQNFKGK